jgi:molecular chaperone Hsp33
MKDLLYRGLVKGINVRFSYAVTTEVAITAIIKHDCDPVVGHLLSRALTAGVLCSPTLGEDERASITWQYPGLLKKVMVDFGSDSDVRGTTSVKQLMNQVSSEEQIYGDTGSLSVLTSNSKTVIASGTCEAVMMDLVSDLCYYFSVSDQLETDMYIGVGLSQDPQSPVHICQGVLLQAMPGCDFEALEKMRRILHSAEFKKSLAQEPDSDNSAEMILRELLKEQEELPEYEIHPCKAPKFKCQCSREKTSRVLATLNEDDVKDILAKDEDVKVSCHFCSEVYSFSPKEVESQK